MEDKRIQLARERAERIRDHLQVAAHEYAVAVQEEDWRTLGYASVQDWADAELGPVKWTPEARQEIGEYLTGAGFTFREIAKATGVSPATVSSDRSRVQKPNTSGSQRQKAARNRERTRRKTKVTSEPANDDDALVLEPDQNGVYSLPEDHQEPAGDAHGAGQDQAAVTPEEATQDAPACAHDRNAYLMVMCDECSFTVEIDDVEPEVLARLLTDYGRHKELLKAMQKRNPIAEVAERGMTHDRPVTLSNTELRVALLAAAGQTNQQIAHAIIARLLDVEKHLTNIYRKLGISG